MLTKRRARARARLTIAARKASAARGASGGGASKRRSVSARTRGEARRRARGKHPLRDYAGKPRTSAEGQGAEYVATMRNFEASVQSFQKANYARAREGFRKLVTSPLREVADRARIHLRLCEQRMSQKSGAPRTAEEQYLCGIAALNRRDLEAAAEHLGKADKLVPRREHVLYALAATHSLRGDRELAMKFLTTAIKLRPANRMQARHDEDFRSLANEPGFRPLLQQ